jgi:hypothetical protein
MKSPSPEILTLTQEAASAFRSEAAASGPIIAAASEGSSTAALAWGIFFGAALFNLAVALLRAPEGYEDEAGFHFAGPAALRRRSAA